MLLQQQQTAEQLLGEAADNLERETTEGVGLDEFVEVHVQKFSRDAEMTTEVEALGEVDHAVFVLRVLQKSAPYKFPRSRCNYPFAQPLQDVDFY